MLSLLAYVWVGLGVANQLVYCIGAGGHAAVELLHPAEHWAGAREAVAADAHTAALPAQSCTDRSLLVQAVKEREGQPDVGRAVSGPVTTVVSFALAAAPLARPYRASWFNLQAAASFRTTVLLI